MMGTFYDLLLLCLHLLVIGDRVVSIATWYGLERLGIESRWERGFVYLSTPALGPTRPPITCVIAGGKWPEHDFNQPPTSCTEVKERSEPHLYSAFVS